MANFTISPNMSLIIPTPGQEPGPNYATDLASSLSIIDGHNHSPGSGSIINTNGIVINADFALNNFNLTLVKTVNFSAQLSSLPGVSPNLGCIYVAGNELYYNDEVGNVVKITNVGSVNSGAGSISGLPSGTASASYSAGSKTFIWQSSTLTAANLDAGSVILREVAASAKGVKLSSPLSLAADYELFFPGSLPASSKILTLDNAGNIASVLDVDNVTLQIVSSTLSVKNQAITQAKLAPRTTGTTVAAGGVAKSSAFTAASLGGSGTIATLTVTITTTGRPVIVGLQSDMGVGQNSFIQAIGGPIILQVTRNGTEFMAYDFGTSAGGVTAFPSSSVVGIDFGVNGSAGTYTYNIVQNAAGNLVGYNNVVLVAYEM